MEQLSKAIPAAVGEEVKRLSKDIESRQHTLDHAIGHGDLDLQKRMRAEMRTIQAEIDSIVNRAEVSA